MALDQVVEEILAQAEKESREIILQGEKEAKSILESARKESKEKTTAFDDETGRLMEEVEKIESSSLSTILKKQMLEAKKEVIDELFMQVMQNVTEMKDSNRGKLITAMLENAEKELGSIGVVWCNENDKRFVKGFKTKMLKTVGGIIAENKDGSVRMNYTFEVLLNKLKEETLNEVAKKIFQG